MRKKSCEEKSLIILASYSSRAVDLLSNHPKVKGSSQPAATGTRRKKMAGNTRGEVSLYH
jgi:hypothetical protein